MGNEASTYIDRIVTAMKTAYTGWPINERPESPASGNRAWYVQVGVNNITGFSNGALGMDAVMTCCATVGYEGRASTHNSSFQFVDIATTLAAWICGWIDEEGGTAARNVRLQVMEEIASHSPAGVEMPTGRYGCLVLWDVPLDDIDTRLEIPGYVTQSPHRPREGFNRDLGVEIAEAEIEGTWHS